MQLPAAAADNLRRPALAAQVRPRDGCRRHEEPLTPACPRTAARTAGCGRPCTCPAPRPSRPPARTTRGSATKPNMPELTALGVHPQCHRRTGIPLPRDAVSYRVQCGDRQLVQGGAPLWRWHHPTAASRPARAHRQTASPDVKLEEQGAIRTVGLRICCSSAKPAGTGQESRATCHNSSKSWSAPARRPCSACRSSTPSRPAAGAWAAAPGTFALQAPGQQLSDVLFRGHQCPLHSAGGGQHRKIYTR